MYVGQLTNIKETTFTHKGVSLPFEPSNTDTGLGTWLWNYAFDSELDVNMTLECNSFIGAVCLDITEDSVKKVEILVDGRVSGAYAAETGNHVGGVINIPVGVSGNTVTARFYNNLKNLTVNSIELLGAHDDGNPLVYPTPKSIEYLDGFAKIKDIVSKNGDADEIYAAEFLKERLTETLGEWQSKRGVVIVFDKNSFKSYDKERYTVKTTQKKITVSAKSRLTLLYGADTILQLSEIKKGVRRFNCDDRPSKELRGFHAGIPELCQFEFMRRLFRYVLLPLRYNIFFVQFAGCVRYDSHPEIAEAWEKVTDAYRRDPENLPTPPHYPMLANGHIIEKADALRYIGFARELGMEIIPEVQSLGHVQYITIAHPEIAEIEEKEVIVKDTRNEDERPATRYHHCYCPSLKESYDIIFDIIDEIVDLVKPERYVHIGHDEVYQIGVCKRCRERGASEVLAEHITKLHDHLAEKGLGTMMWSDMIQPPPYRPYPSYKAIDMIPKDVVMLDFVWYFNIPDDIEENLLKKGFKVAVGNLYSSHYPRYESRIKKPGMLGGEISTWHENNEEVYGRNGKMWDMMYLSEMLWNTENYDSRNRRTYTDIIAKNVMPSMRDNVHGKYNPKGYKATDVKLPKGKCAPSSVLAVCPKAIVLDGEKISVGKAFERVVFEHATLSSAPRVEWTHSKTIGNYKVTYEDGSYVEVPVKYAQNIMAYNTTYAEPRPQPYHRHNGYVGTWFADPTYQGKRCDGSDVCVMGYVWENPSPEKKIETVEYTAAEDDWCGLILAGIKGLTRK
ncbi:MAG: hypothetical protein E7612_00620 [Ruminococcaceae bacterium]|nr:hypothetical protein [Oscillospiraceae bacterium]